MIKKTICLFAVAITVLLGSSLLSPPRVAAQVAPACDASAGFLGIPPWYKYLKVNDDGNGNCTVELAKKPGTDRTDLTAAVTRILLAVFEIILRIAGIIAVIFVVYGGIQYTLSQGEPDRTKGARTTIINALVGLAIAISATAIVNLIGNNITKAGP